MAYGLIKILAASSHIDLPLSGTAGGNQYPSIKVLNPNDGVVYVARNRDAPSNNYGDWDWKVPSQSYAMLPGPFTSAGLFYLDQSGAGHQGEITVYPSQQKIDDPLFVAVGRALLATTTSMDVTEGTVPANPGSGILRLWADGGDLLHLLNSAGIDKTTIDTQTTLGGILSGTLPNPGMAAGAALANLAAHSVSSLSSNTFGIALSTTSATFVASGDSISYTPQANSDVLLIYTGNFQNTVAGALNTFQLAVDATRLGAVAYGMNAGAAGKFEIVIPVLWSNPTAVAHTIQMYFDTNSGTLNQFDNRNLIVMEFRR